MSTVHRNAPLLDAFATQRCEVRLQFTLDPLTRQRARRDFSQAAQHRIAMGNQHQANVFDELRTHLGQRMVEILADDRASAQDATEDAMARGVEVIARGWLPPDRLGRRVGRPDLLVRASDGYVPVGIKLHLVTTPGGSSLEVSSLATPFPADAVAASEVKFRKGGVLRNDALQLAHYRQILASRGLAASVDGCLGGIIDGSGTLWWIDLEAGSGLSGETFAAMYDRLFAGRISLANRVSTWIDDRTTARPLDPWWHKECEGCPFEEVCRDELVATDDVSLVRWSSQSQLAVLRDAGVITRSDLADLDLELIDLGERLMETSLPLPKLLAAAQNAPTEQPLEDLIGARMGVRRRLASAGVVSIADLRERDQKSLVLAGSVRDLGRLVRRARAHRAGGAARQVARTSMEAARADVEVDVDMESYGASTYLWGALVTVRGNVTGVDEGYRSFACFDVLDEQAEAAVFGEFWSWLLTLRTEVRRQGGTFRSYCFWRAAEEGQMRRAARIGGDGLPTERHLDRFFGSEDWVDLHEIVKEQIITEGPIGLKVLAGRAGFSWRDPDPSGEASIGWYELARDGHNDSLQRLLAYNEDDVKATRALRDWIEGAARDLPHIDDLGATP